MPNFCIIGPSGCGKSTQAKQISEKYGLTHFSIGAILRSYLDANPNTPIKSYVDAGKWVPEEMLMPIVFNSLSTCNFQNFIIDGFPRVLLQGRLLEEELIKHQKHLDHIFHLTIPFTTIFSRRLKSELETGVRFSDPGRTDENEQSIAQRQQSYDESILPILNYYTDKELLSQIDATPDISTIFNNICSKIDQLLIHKEIS